MSRLGWLESQQAAKESATTMLRAGAPFYLWRMRDGTFDWTAVPNPESVWPWREYEGAECVEYGNTPCYGTRRPFAPAVRPVGALCTEGAQ